MNDKGLVKNSKKPSSVLYNPIKLQHWFISQTFPPVFWTYSWVLRIHKHVRAEGEALNPTAGLKKSVGWERFIGGADPGIMSSVIRTY